MKLLLAVYVNQTITCKGQVDKIKCEIKILM